MNAIVLKVREQGLEHVHPVEQLLATKSVRTIKAYQTTLLRVSKIITDSEDWIACPFELMGFEQWIEVRKVLEQELSVPTFNKYLTHLRAVVKQYHSSGLISVDTLTRSLDALQSVKGEQVRKPRYLSRQELESIRDVCSIRDKALLYVMVLEGLRIAEVCSLRWEHVNLDTGTLTVHEGKGNRTDYIMMGTQTVDALRVLQTQSKGEQVFTAKNKDALSERGLGHIVSEWITDANVTPFAPHDLRRTLGTNIWLKTGDMRQVQAVLRHKNLITSQNYILRVVDEQTKLKAVQFKSV